MNKYFFLLLLAGLSLKGYSQDISFTLGTGQDTLVYPKDDSTYKVSFTLGGIHFTSPVRVTLTTSLTRTAKKDVHYQLRDAAGRGDDTLRINPVNGKGEFSLFLPGGQKDPKSLMLEALVYDNGLYTKKQELIQLIPKPAEKPKPTAKDTIGLKILNDINIHTYTMKGKTPQKDKVVKKRRLRRDLEWDATINMDSLIIQQKDSNKIIPTLYATDGRIFYSDTALELKSTWLESDRLYLNGDKDKSFIYVRDLLHYVPDVSKSAIHHPTTTMILLPKNN
jgi:hypothetical protein